MLVSTLRAGDQDTSPPVPLESLSNMPMPGVGAGAALARGVTRAGFGVGLRTAVSWCAGAAVVAGVGCASAGAAIAAREAGRDTEVPRSTQRSGSSLHREPALATGANTMAVATTSRR